MPLVQTLLAHYDETLPFALGLVLHTAPPPQGNDGLVLSWLGGGSGIFMSQVRPCVVSCPIFAILIANMPRQVTVCMQTLPSSVIFGDVAKAPPWLGWHCHAGKASWLICPQDAQVHKTAQGAVQPLLAACKPDRRARRRPSAPWRRRCMVSCAPLTASTTSRSRTASARSAS